MDLISLVGLFSNYRPLVFSRELLYVSKNYALIYTRLFKNLQASIIRSMITWSEMRQQTTQAKKVY